MNRLLKWQSLILVFAVVFTSIFGSFVSTAETVYAAEQETDEADSVYSEVESTESATETESVTDTEAVIETESVTETESGTGTENESEVTTESGTETDTEESNAIEDSSATEDTSETGTEAETETETETEAETETETEAETETETETESEEPISIASCEITLSSTSCTYNGSVWESSATVTMTIDGSAVTLVEDTDYTVSYSDNTNAGTATVTITGQGNYTGTATATFTIEAKSIASATVTLSTTSYTYNGTARKPTPTVTLTLNGETVTLVKNTDYTVSYSSNTNAGTAKVTIKGKGNYSGSISQTYTIKAKSLSGASVTLSTTSYTYNGSAKKPSATVQLTVNGETLTLVKNTDYTVSYSSNTNAGTAKVTIKGKGNYSGSVSKTFTIKTKSISSATVTLSTTSYTYNGSARKPSTTVKITLNGSTVTLKKNTDYTVTYSNNTKIGTAKVTIKGKGNYSGSISTTFTIGAKSISSATVTLSTTSYTYNGTARKPTPTVKITLNGSTVTLKKGTDYTVSYSNNTKAGTAKVTIKGKGNYKGSVSKTFTIKKKSISSATVTLSKTSYTYNGSAKKPTATVKIKVNGKTVTLKKGTDYTVSYSNNTKIGTATVTIKGKGNYSGTVKKTFKIVPAKTTLKSLSMSGKSIKVTWSKVSGASGYGVYRKTSDGSWKLIKTITSGSTVSYTDSSVTAGVKYYYRVRAYKTSGSSKIWGSYSSSKSKTCKPGTVTLVSAKLTSATKAKITWKSQSTADGYYVYRKSGDSWKKIATVTSGTSYTDSGLSYGKTYTYTVKAYWKSGDSTIGGYYDEDGISVKVTYTYKYVNGYKLYYDASGNQITDVLSIIGDQSSYEIKVNKQCNTVTVYAKDGDNGYIIPVKAFVCSCGTATPLGTFYTPQKYRWHTLQHGVEGQWCTRITSGILFHSVWYYSRDNTTLSVTQYNKLGTTASAGCVRLTAADAKWIYDNCALGTKVTIYNSSTPGPLGKPTAKALASWHTWDPTDPNAKYLCEKYGCH